MRIIYVAHSLLNRGGDKIVLAHAGWLIACGHEVEFCCNVVDTVLVIPEGVRFSKPLFSGTLGTIVSALLQRRDADIILASIIPMACFLYPRSRRKVVYFAQDYSESYYTSSLLRGVVRLFNYVGLSFFRIPVIAVSNHLADLLRNRFRALVDVAENGVDTEVFYPDQDPELINAKGDRKALLLFSRNDPGKGFDIALNVVRRLAAEVPGLFEVWTVGESCKGIFEGVIHRDFEYVREDRLRQIMSSADTFLYPTRHEGFGLMPLEAFACRCPVVTTDAVAFASHLENALVAPVGDIERITDYTLQIMSGSAENERLTNRGLQTAEKMSLKRALAQFASILDHMASGVSH
jgi:glycosyltransferase involved in cell wall biosynthesis